MPDTPILRDEVLRAAITAAENITIRLLIERQDEDKAHTAAQAAGMFTTVFAAVQLNVRTWFDSPEGTVQPRQPPAYDVEKSITPDFLFSLEDGKPYKNLTRHLKGLGLTPDTYRAKWGLPLDYPMSAPEYSKRRSDFAKNSGLGQRPPKDSSPASIRRL